MGKKLFIIEDDANLLYGLKAQFSLNGFKVESDSGSEELEGIMKKIKNLKPSYIILDLILPKVDGFSILSSIRSDKETSKIPVFIFTNLSDKDSRLRSESLGSDHYFIKSDFTAEEFVGKINKIIENLEKENSK